MESESAKLVKLRIEKSKRESRIFMIFYKYVNTLNKVMRKYKIFFRIFYYRMVVVRTTHQGYYDRLNLR